MDIRAIEAIVKITLHTNLMGNLFFVDIFLFEWSLIYSR